MSNLFAYGLSKRSLLWVGVLLLALIVAACGSAPKGTPLPPGDGDGGGGDPPGNGQSGQCPQGVDCVIIRTLADLKAMNDLTWTGVIGSDLPIPREMKRHYILANNIDASETRNWQNDDGSVGFVPIGKYKSSSEHVERVPFAGYFDGNGKTIKNLFIDRTEADEFINVDTGLFAVIAYGGTVVGLTLENVNIKGEDAVGALAGTVEEGTIRNVHVIGSVQGSGSAFGGVGGVVGNNSGTIEDSTFFGNVEAKFYAGGLVGINEADDETGTIENSSAEATVKGATAGGLVGANHGGTISNSNSRAKVQSDALQGNVGGLVGYNTGTITHSKSTTSRNDWIEGMYHVGGLVGGNQGLIENSSSDANVKSEREPHSGFPHGVGGLAGYNAGGEVYGGIKNSHSSGQVNAASGHVGGLVGRNNGPGEIKDSSSISPVTGGEDTGGLVGLNQGNITGSFSAKELVRGEGNVGGLVGQNQALMPDTGVIKDSYSWNAVKGGSTAGGLVGYLFSGAVKSSYSTGSVDEADEIGGLIGESSGPQFVSVENAYWDVTSSGQPTSEAGGEGRTTTQMHQQATYASWDFDDIWEMPAGGGYPDLQNNRRPANLP